jgi:hypothetical protein
MIFKIITDAQGDVVAYGPNDDNYAPAIPAGCTLSTVAALPTAIKSPAQIAQDLEAAVDRHIDSVAKADKWDSRITCTMRAGYPNPWQNKAIAFGQWMDTCYAHCIQVQADVAAGTRPVPTSAELIAELPVMVWPV